MKLTRSTGIYIGLVALSVVLLIVGLRTNNIVWLILYLGALLAGQVVRRQRVRAQREADARETEELRDRLRRLTE